jgi:predicted house-cleaning noncanonical NTP pyrophosphatase (MazG superfamily)
MAGRDFVLEVVEKYKQSPCLWQVTNIDYHNKFKRNAALEELVALFKTKEPEANKASVLKRITSLRSCFKKEHNKVGFFPFIHGIIQC